jgi:hypothetical protein
LTFLLSQELAGVVFIILLLKHLYGDSEYLWHVTPPRGRLGGLILGANASLFYSKFLVKNKDDGYMWALYAVYGPAQDVFKFLIELAHVCSCQTHPNSHRGGGGFQIRIMMFLIPDARTILMQ